MSEKWRKITIIVVGVFIIAVLLSFVFPESRSVFTRIVINLIRNIL